MPVPALSSLLPKRPWRRIGTAIALLLFLDLLSTLVWFPAQARARRFPEEGLPVTGAPVLILGAGVLPDKEPTQVLQGRLRTALALHQGGKVRWFLVSGDNRTPSYNEPQAMRKWLLKHGVPPTLIVGDFAGRRTYDSLRRAQAVFGLHRVVIVTSDFHLARAIFLARSLGLEVWGVPASTEEMAWHSRLGFWLREYAARHVALWDTWFPPDTLLGPREPTPEDWLDTAPKEGSASVPGLSPK